MSVTVHMCVLHYTEVRFASFLSGGFITAIVVNSLERKLAKRTVKPKHFNLGFS